MNTIYMIFKVEGNISSNTVSLFRLGWIRLCYVMSLLFSYDNYVVRGIENLHLKFNFFSNIDPNIFLF